MNKLITPVIILIFLSSCKVLQKPEEQKNTMSLENDIDKLSYSIGVSIADNLKSQGLDSLNSDAFVSAINDVLDGNDPQMSRDESNALIQDYFTKLQQEKQQDNMEEGIKFLEENGKKDGVTTLESGMQYEVLTEGTGAIPTLNDKVTTHYHGTLIDGTIFDSSVERGQPASFPVSGVIAGWTEALQLMKVGSKWKLYIPSNLAYGDRGAGGVIGPNATLIFEVELLSID